MNGYRKKRKDGKLVLDERRRKWVEGQNDAVKDTSTSTKSSYYSLIMKPFSDLFKRQQNEVGKESIQFTIPERRTSTVQALAMSQLSKNVQSNRSSLTRVVSMKASVPVETSKRDSTNTKDKHIPPGELKSACIGESPSVTFKETAQNDVIKESTDESPTATTVAAVTRETAASEKNTTKIENDKLSKQIKKVSLLPLLPTDDLFSTFDEASQVEVEVERGRNYQPHLEKPVESATALNCRRNFRVLTVESDDDDDDDEEENTDIDEKEKNGMRKSSNLSMLSTDSNVRVSLRGTTVYVGDWMIKDNGLSRSAMSSDELDTGAPRGSDAYVVVGTLGKGASGTVLEALHIPTLTIVALKVLPVHDAEKNQHLSKELDVLYKNLSDLKLMDQNRLSGDHANSGADPVRDSSSTATCPFVLSMYDAFVDPNASKINLVMEFMDGGSLQDLVDNGGTKDETVLADISYQVIKGLQFLHANNQLHRDIKPGNILLNCRGEVKVADFGISIALDEAIGHTKSFVGTVFYMAPERLVADTYSYPADVWSMGLTILTVATGRFPIPKSNDGFWGIMDAICAGDSPTAGPEFSDLFNSFISACLRKAPEERATPTQLLDHPFFAGYLRRAYSSGGSSPLDQKTKLDEDRGAGGGGSALSQLAAAKDIAQRCRSLSLDNGGATYIDFLSVPPADCAKSVPLGMDEANPPPGVSMGKAREKERGGTPAGDRVLRRALSNKFSKSWVEFSEEVKSVRIDHLLHILEMLRFRNMHGQRSSNLHLQLLHSDSLEGSPADSAYSLSLSSDPQAGETSGSRQSFSRYLPQTQPQPQPVVLLPSLRGSGALMWRHLAAQLRLPCDMVMNYVEQYLSPDCFAAAE